MAVKVCGLNCSLKSSSSPSNTSVMMEDVVGWMRDHEDIDYEEIRVADYNVKPGVEWDEGEGDDWPQIGERVLAAEVLLFGTPIWLGHPSSIAQRVIERMDAWLFSYDQLGRKKVYGRVARTRRSSVVHESEWRRRGMNVMKSGTLRCSVALCGDRALGTGALPRRLRGSP